MDKIFTIKYDEDVVNNISDVISEFIRAIDDEDIDGIFTVCYEKGKKSLSRISLCVVSNDLVFIKNINGISLENDICPITVIGVPTMCYYGVSSDVAFDRLIKSGIIIFDKDDTLRKIQKNIENNKSVRTLKYRGAIRIKPPIQYIK